jgi:probable rRNA maturation factor
MAATRTLTIRDRQRTRAVHISWLRRIAASLLNDLLDQPFYDLGVYLVAAPEMTRLNETFLRHRGSTDVITFDYSEGQGGEALHGEIFICVDEALLQARRFKTPWRAELVRYLVHGVLHLRGHDDKRVSARQRMKREENGLLRALANRFDLA